MVVLLFLLVVSSFGSAGLKDSTMDKPELTQFFLPPQDKYLDWYKVTDDNLPQRVLQSVDLCYRNYHKFIKIISIWNNWLFLVTPTEDCWIVALCPENQLPAVWRNYILGYRGTIFFGRFWDKDGKDLKQRFGYKGKPLVRWFIVTIYIQEQLIHSCNIYVEIKLLEL